MAADGARCWFTLDDASKPVGPYTAAELAGYASAGLLLDSQVFWKEGNAGWVSLAELPELATAHAAATAYRQQHGPAAGSQHAGPSGSHAAGAQHHPHQKVITAKPSDPLEAFKQQVAAAEAAAKAGAGGDGAGDAAAAAAPAGDDDHQAGRAATPDELEFEDDDGTLYRWDALLRKYMPAGDADSAGAAAGAAGEQPGPTGSGAGGAGHPAAAAAAAAGYDVEAMTFVAEEEVIPTLAAVRAAEEAAAEGKGKKRGGGDCADATGQQPGGKKARPNEPHEQQPAAAGGDAAAAGGQAPQEGDQPPGWFELKKNTSVYVTGLPDDTDADEVAGVFAKCGIIKLDDAGQPRIKLYRDKASGLLKGDGLVTYLKAPSVALAVQILDGAPLRDVGPPLSVSEAKFEMKGRAFVDKKGGNAAGAAGTGAAGAAAASGGGGGGKGGGGRGGGGKKKRGGGRGGGGGGGRGGGGAPGSVIQGKLERKLGWGGFDDALPPERVTVVLKHMFNPDDAAEGGPSFGADLEADVTAECAKLGVVEKVRVFAQHPEGVVTVRFKAEEPAQACVSLMHGRFFGGQRLRAALWDGFTNFHGVKAENKQSAEEQAARLEAYARELEAKAAAKAAAAATDAAAAAAGPDS